MIRALRRLWRYLTGDALIDEYLTPTPEFETNPIALPDNDWNRNSPVVLSDRSLLTEDERALFDQISPPAAEKVVAYPPKADEQDARDWVTEQLMERTGGLTRHPADKTDYPEPPNEVDLAARAYVANNYRFVTPFSHGMSMRYLGELLDRAKRKDRTLSTEDLMALRSRGLI